MRPLPVPLPNPKLSPPGPLIPVPSGGSSFGASFGASSLIIGSSIFCCSSGGAGGGVKTGGGGGGAMLTNVRVSCLDAPPDDASFATTTIPVITIATTMIAIRNRLKKFCGGCCGSSSKSMPTLFPLRFCGQADLCDSDSSDDVEHIHHSLILSKAVTTNDDRKLRRLRFLRTQPLLELRNCDRDGVEKNFPFVVDGNRLCLRLG